MLAWPPTVPSRHRWLSAVIARLGELLDAATPIGSGIGGKSVLLEAAGTPVFVKRVRLTDLERRPENVHSTANLFGLPVFCQYGIGTTGSPGFGAWRELAVHTMTTNWVLAGDYEGFPLMYHWRVLPGPGQPLPEELADVERAVAYWGGGPEVRRRIEALAQSSASLMLFLEYVPQNLHDWLGAQIGAGDEAAERACAMVDRELEAGVSFMNARGLLHFDAHFENILTDGRRLFFADYGLAISSRFELAQDEADFFRRHQHLRPLLQRHASGELAGRRPVRVRTGRTQGVCARLRSGESPGEIPAAVAAVLTRHAPVAAVMADFYRQFQQESRAASYPLEAIRQIRQQDIPA